MTRRSPLGVAVSWPWRPRHSLPRRGQQPLATRSQVRQHGLGQADDRRKCLAFASQRPIDPRPSALATFSEPKARISFHAPGETFIDGGVGRKMLLSRPDRAVAVAFFASIISNGETERGMKQVARLAVGFAGLAAGYELGSLLTPIVGRIGFWVVTLATMFAVAGIADQIAKRLFRIRL